MPSSRVVESRLGRAVICCVVLAFVVFLSSWAGLVLVIAGQVVRGWAVCGTLFFTALVLVLARTVVRRRALPGTIERRRNQGRLPYIEGAVIELLIVGQPHATVHDKSCNALSYV
jgi:hypothetical protein